MWNGRPRPLPLTLSLLLPLTLTLLLLLPLCVILSEIFVRDQRTKTQSKDPCTTSRTPPIQGILPTALVERTLLSAAFDLLLIFFVCCPERSRRDPYPLSPASAASRSSPTDQTEPHRRPLAPPCHSLPQSCPLHSPTPTCKKDASGRGSRGQCRRTPFFV